MRKTHLSQLLVICSTPSSKSSSKSKNCSQHVLWTFQSFRIHVSNLRCACHLCCVWVNIENSPRDNSKLENLKRKANSMPTIQVELNQPFKHEISRGKKGYTKKSGLSVGCVFAFPHCRNWVKAKVVLQADEYQWGNSSKFLLCGNLTALQSRKQILHTGVNTPNARPH